jgi:hypothetical protein
MDASVFGKAGKATARPWLEVAVASMDQARDADGPGHFNLVRVAETVQVKVAASRVDPDDLEMSAWGNADEGR